MTTLHNIMGQVQHLLDSGKMWEAEQLVDQLAELDPEVLAVSWSIRKDAPLLFISHFYNTIGTYYQQLAISANKQENREGVVAAARNAERCHEKAFDLFDISAEDLLYLPSGDSPYNKNFIFTLWGLGASKYVLSKKEESREYLQLCLRLISHDEQAIRWQSEASTYLRLIEQKSVQIALRVRKAESNMFDSNLLVVEGELLEWDEYAKPMQQTFAVHLRSKDIESLETQGFKNPRALLGHVLVLISDPSGDLKRKMILLEIV